MLIDEPNPVAKILDWYDDNRRVLPWRALPGEPVDPYRVWLSEIMLQQTVVKAVIPYFEKFVTTWPTVFTLAAADLDEVLTAWAGLGYYARARNLHACAKAVCLDHSGRFPETVKALQTLPGIGAYTAAAIASIAFDEPIVPLDGNIERVTARYFAIVEPLPGVKKTLRERAQQFNSDQRPGDLAQALMDLGSGICMPRNPVCEVCPLSSACMAYARNITEELPVKAAKKARPSRFATAYVVHREDGCVLLRRRAETGLLGGMMEIPSSPWVDKISGTATSAHAPLDADWVALNGVVTHVFTHFSLELRVFTASVPVLGSEKIVELNGDYRWVHRSDLDEHALPSVMHKVVRHAWKADQVSSAE